MYIPQIKTFLTVCEKGSFTKAAGSLYISPSAVLQQINALEEDLGVKLVIRRNTGISLTPAGTHLRETAADWVKRGDSIREELARIANQENTICIGTSLLEKCRLLYDLWMLYSEQDPRINMKLVPIGPDHAVPLETDLIESTYSGVNWMRAWNFQEICRVPFGFAVSGKHPLAGQEQVTPAQLAGETVLVFDHVPDKNVAAMFLEMEEAGVILKKLDAPTHSILWEAAFHNQIILAPMCWDDILVNMKLVACTWSYSLPYGILYRKDPSRAVQSFLKFVAKTYGEGNAREIVPVLER